MHFCQDWPICFHPCPDCQAYFNRLVFLFSSVSSCSSGGMRRGTYAALGAELFAGADALPVPDWQRSSWCHPQKQLQTYAWPTNPTFPQNAITDKHSHILSFFQLKIQGCVVSTGSRVLKKTLWKIKALQVSFFADLHPLCTSPLKKMLNLGLLQDKLQHQAKSRHSGQTLSCCCLSKYWHFLRKNYFLNYGFH